MTDGFLYFELFTSDWKEVTQNNCFRTVACLWDVLNGRRPSKWFPQKPMYQVAVYLDNEEQQYNLFIHLRNVLHRTPTKPHFTD